MRKWLYVYSHTLMGCGYKASELKSVTQSTGFCIPLL